MIIRIKIFILILLLFSCTHIQPCFTPGQPCATKIITQIDSAKKEILVQAYSFTSMPIAKALLNAHKRGVNVQIILDKSQRNNNYSSYTFFKNSGIPISVDSNHAIAHNKIIIIDKEIVITGSYNFTNAAEEKNAENILIIKSPVISQDYLLNWQTHRNHSE